MPPRKTKRNDGRFAFNEVYVGELNARYTTRFRLPTYLKFGGKGACGSAPGGCRGSATLGLICPLDALQPPHYWSS